MTTIASYIESLLHSSECFRSLRGIHPVTDYRGQPVFSASGTVVRFSVKHEGRLKSLMCPLSPIAEAWTADGDRILNVTNRNNPYIAPCEVRKGEMLTFDPAGRPCRNDVMLCGRPEGVPFLSFVRAHLNRSDHKPLRLLLGNIAAMAESLAADSITHGNLKPENIYVTSESRPCAVDFAAYQGRRQADDDMALGLLALGVFILGGEPKLHSLLGGVEIFRPGFLRSNARNLITQAEFSHLRHVAELISLLSTLAEDTDAAPSTGPASSVRREDLCMVLSGLASTPFAPLPIMIELSSNDDTVRITESDGTPAIAASANPPEDPTLLVDFRSCDFTDDISDTLVRFRNGGKWGFADRYGRRLSADEYLSAENFYEGRAKVGTASGCGLIDRTGAYVMPPIYEMLEWHGRENIATACLEGRWEVYDRGGRALTAAAYDWIGDVSEGTLIVRRGNRFGFITTSGSPVTDIRYDEAYSFRDGRALVGSGPDSYHIDHTGKKCD